VKAHQVLALDVRQSLDGAVRLPRVRMRAVERLRERIDGHRRRVVFLLANRGDQLIAPRLDLRIGKARVPRHVGGQCQHGGEIIRQRRRGNRHLVAAGDGGERGAAAIEVVGDRIGRSRHGAPIENARAQSRSAFAIDRIGERACPHADQQADGGCGVIGFRDDGHAVVQRHAPGVQRHIFILRQIPG
jgi:hypothetical protein